MFLGYTIWYHTKVCGILRMFQKSEAQRGKTSWHLQAHRQGAAENSVELRNFAPNGFFHPLGKTCGYYELIKRYEEIRPLICVQCL